MIVVGEGPDQRPAKLVYRRGLFAGIRFRDIPDGMDDEFGGAPRNAAHASAAASIETAVDEFAAPTEGHPERRSPGIRRLEPERLPEPLVRLLPWVSPRA